MRPRFDRSLRGFTLIELLVVISIIALLIGILLPALGAARKSARSMQSLSNIRQLGVSMSTYAADNKLKFAPSTGKTYAPTDVGYDPAGGSQQWHDIDRIGYYLPEDQRIGGTSKNDSFGGSVFIDPVDVQGASRSYAMNVYASGETPGKPPTGAGVGILNNGAWNTGTFFTAEVADASSTFLFTTAWSRFQVGTRFYCTDVVGIGPVGGDLTRVPAVRFANQNINYGAAPFGNRFGDPIGRSEIDWTRHGDPIKPSEVGGLTHFAFVDGHAEPIRQSDTVTEPTGYSTLKVLWSPKDQELTP